MVLSSLWIYSQVENAVFTKNFCQDNQRARENERSADKSWFFRGVKLVNFDCVVVELVEVGEPSEYDFIGGVLGIEREHSAVIGGINGKLN